METAVPEALSLRDTSFDIIVGATLFVSVMLLAMARAAQSNVYGAVAISLIKVSTLRGYLKETLSLGGRSSLLLIMNYWISFGLIVYLIGNYFEFKLINTWLLSLTVPLAVLLWHLSSMVITGWITGELEVFKAPLMMKLLGAQFLGIVYFICGLIWVLQPDYINAMLIIVFWAFLIESIFRVLKSISFVLSQGVSWYYIILYFCTLEILPLIICYYYIMQNLRV